MTPTAGGRRPRPRPTGVAAGLAGTLTVHAAGLALMVLTVRPPTVLPPVYAVELVAAPAPAPQARRAPEIVQRPPAAEPAVPVKAPPKKPVTTPAPARPPDRTREPTPRTTPEAQPAPGEEPSTGTDAVTVRTPGLTFPYPEYLRNVVAQVYRRWDRPGGNVALQAEVFFFIQRDGTVRGMRFVTSSGNFAFDLGAQGAIEAAGNARAFGPLPDGYEADVLPVSFFFTPRGAR